MALLVAKWVPKENLSNIHKGIQEKNSEKPPKTISWESWEGIYEDIYGKFPDFTGAIPEK